MFDVLTPLAQAAGDLALQHFGRLAEGDVAQKAPLDLVTEADRAVEALILARLQAAFPQDGVLGEEGGKVAAASGRVWVIDPIDGTFNFVRGGAQWAVSIGLWQDGQPVLGVVHAPVLGLTLTGGVGHAPLLNGRALPGLTAYRADRAAVGVALSPAVPIEVRQGILTALMAAQIKFRVCNATTISLLEVATGEVDAHLGYGERAWDVMAAWPVLQALGAEATLDWASTPLDATLRYVLGKPGAVAACRGLLDQG